MSEPCRNCGAPLAADQRYCLNCGQRCGPPRIDFGKQEPPAKAPAPDSATPPENDPRQRDYTPLAAVGGIAVLGLMLLVGVLIGKGNAPATTAAPPQVVRVGGEADAGATASNEGGGEKSGKAKKAKGAEKASNGKDLVSGKGGAGPVEASDQALQELQEQSPDEYSKSSAKLPDEIATGGAPPPTDHKTPGGGSKGTAIE